MDILRSGAQPTAIGPAEHFTGTVRIDSPFKGTEGANISGAFVTFEPGARSAWHTHPRGQVLVVTAGKGWTQCEGGPIVAISAGDIVSCPCNHRHWHGATPTTAMTHLAVQEAQDGKVVEWMEKVTDQEYRVGMAI